MTRPNEATGQLVTPASPIQRIIRGNRVIQNSKAWLAQRTAPVILFADCIMWWWLFQYIAT